MCRSPPGKRRIMQTLIAPTGLGEAINRRHLADFACIMADVGLLLVVPWRSSHGL